MSASDVLKFIKEKEAEFVDLRFTDPRGKLQHLTMDSTIVDEKMLNEGVFFDGSSIAGWKAINESDMILKPDLNREIIDPFTSHNTLVLFCDVLDAVKKTPYERDPRSTAKKAEYYLKKSGIGDKAFFGPEAEFFVFDDVKFKNDQSLYEKNRFDITDFEALNYPRIVKNKKVGLIILIIVQDGKKFRYALTEWSDFIISPKYNPHERRKTKVKMKNLIPFEKLLILSNDV